MKKYRWVMVVAAVAAVAAAITAGLATAGSSSKHSAKLTKVTLQLKWVTQAQFAGYYAAKAKGYYNQVGLDVNIKVGGPDISPEQVVLGRQAEFGVNWLPSLLAQRDTGNDLVDIGQVFTRSGTTEVTWKSSGIDTFSKMRGKKFGVWILGNEFEQEAALVKYGLDPHKDVTLVKQNFDVIPFLKHQIDATSAFVQAIVHHRRYGQAYSDLGSVLEQDGRMSEAIAVYERAIALGVANDRIQQRLAALREPGAGGGPTPGGRNERPSGTTARQV